MASLISQNSHAPKIDTTAFPNMDKTRLLYWTSEQVDASSAWYADFGTGTIDHYFGDYDFLNERFYVRLVRAPSAP